LAVRANREGIGEDPVFLRLAPGIALAAGTSLLMHFAGGSVYLVLCAIVVVPLWCSWAVQHKKSWRLFYARYATLLCAGRHRDACARLKEACDGDSEGFMKRYRIVLAEAHNEWPAAAMRATLFFGVNCVVVLVVMWLSPPGENGPLPELSKLEFGALIGTCLTAGITLLSFVGHLNGKINKVLFLLIFPIECAVAGAAYPLFRDSDIFGLRSEEIHMWSVFSINVLLLLVDLVALCGLWTDQRSDDTERRRREIFEMCVVCDAPMLFSFGAVVLFVWLRQAEMEAGARGGLLAGAVLVQCVSSAWLFWIVRERVIPRTESNKNDAPARHANLFSGRDLVADPQSKIRDH
jgi:hypothetical protein